MARMTLFILVALLQFGCSDHSDRSVPPAPSSLSIDFPPPGAHFERDSIPVRGRIEPTDAEGLQIRVDGGADAIEAVVAQDGSWVATAVPLGDGDQVTITAAISGSDTPRAQATAVVTRQRQVVRPRQVVAGFNEENLIFNHGDRDLREYTGAGAEVTSYSVQAAGLPAMGRLLRLPSSHELLVPLSMRLGGCNLFAVDMAEQRERLVYQFLWPDDNGYVRNCSSLRIGVNGARIFVEDNVADAMIVLDTTGNVLSTHEGPASVAENGALHVPASAMDVGYLVRTISGGTRAPVGVVEVLSIDLLTGDTIDFFQSSIIDLFENTAPHVTTVGENIYFAIDDKPGLLSLSPFAQQFFQVSGYKANDVQAVTGLSATEVVTLDEYGGVSKLDIDSHRSTYLFDLDPFASGPILGFSDVRTHDDALLLEMQHVLSRPYISGTREERFWKSVYALDLTDLSLRQLFATNGTGLSDSLSPTSVLRNATHSIAPEGRPDQPLLLQIDHSNAERIPLPLPGLAFGDELTFITSLDGNYLVATRDDGVFEYNIETLELTRQLPMHPLSGFQSDYRVSARFAGANADVFILSRRGDAVFRANFETETVDLVSGLDRGEGPVIRTGAQQALVSWSPEENAVYIASNETLTIWRVDLGSGNRNIVFTRNEDRDNLPRAFGSMRYLPERKALLLSSGAAIYYLDLTTGASALIPTHIGAS